MNFVGTVQFKMIVPMSQKWLENKAINLFLNGFLPEIIIIEWTMIGSHFSPAKARQEVFRTFGWQLGFTISQLWDL